MTKAKTSAPAKALARVGAQAPVEVVAPAAPALTVGFEKALVMLNPEWRTTMTEDEVNRARHFYHQGIQDVYLVARIGEQQLAQNFQAIMGTLVVGGEERVAAQIAEQERLAKSLTPATAVTDGSTAPMAASPQDVERAAVGLPPKASKPAKAKARKGSK